MPSTPQPRFYLPELDGLRFIAFLLVFIHNANPILKGTFLEKFSAYSWFGVDLFFCLSGFLITKLLVTEHEQTGKVNIRNFYIRRALRILPLYFFYIIVGSIVIAPVEGRNVNLPWHILSLSTFTFNFAYFALLPSPILIFVHLWSISYEEQFYAVIPWLVRKLGNTTHLTKALWLISFFVVGLILRALFIYFEILPAAIYFLPITHFDSILGGMALGFGILGQPNKFIKPWTVWFTGAVAFLLFFSLPNNDSLGWGLMATYLSAGIGTTSIVYLIAKSKHNLIAEFLKHPVLVNLGKISYGLYVFHFGAFTIATWAYASIFGVQKIFSQSTLPILFIALVITVLFSVTSFRLIEGPFLKLKYRFSTV